MLFKWCHMEPANIIYCYEFQQLCSDFCAQFDDEKFVHRLKQISIKSKAKKFQIFNAAIEHDPQLFYWSFLNPFFKDLKLTLSRS